MKTNSSAVARAKEENGTWHIHTVDQHLRSVAVRAGHYAQAFGADWGTLAGRWHDLGKYNSAFQQYIKKVSGFDPDAHIETGGNRPNHSSAGALYAVEQLGIKGRVLAYLIAGHHTGLPDWHKEEGVSGGSLANRLQEHELLDNTLKADIPTDILKWEEPITWPPPGGKVGFALWMRMLFSSLIDADRLDAEAFMNENEAAARGQYPELGWFKGKFDSHMKALMAGAAASPVNRLRAEILTRCREQAKHAPGIYTLSVPTGGGKTLSSLAFALEHALAHHKHRIIYAIPYTSIIEQTANTFRDIFGDVIIEHHSNIDIGEKNETSQSQLASENWDAPLIVTTNVQLFESLFAARTSRCRKLHRLVNSVIVLDETQLLPPELLDPIVQTIQLLSDHYGVTFVLSTATQPALRAQKDAYQRTTRQGLDKTKEIIEQPQALFEQLDRVHIELPEDMDTPVSWEHIAQEACQHERILIIVGRRRDARDLCRLMPDGTLHLSALMCPQHRSNVISEIKKKLQGGSSVRVVSTQLVEAGVDLDFPVVYRAMAGLDAIAQAAGRCNREGKAKKGLVRVFIPPTRSIGLLGKAESSTRVLLPSLDKCLINPKNFTAFFDHFYDSVNTTDKHEILELQDPKSEITVQFRTVAQRFRLVDDKDMHTVFVNYDDDSDTWLKRLKIRGPERWLLRKLQRYAISLYAHDFNPLLRMGAIQTIQPDLYENAQGIYDNKYGFLTDGKLIPESTIIAN